MGNNEIELAGKVVKTFYFMYSLHGESFYGLDIEVKRTSGVCDRLKCICSDRVYDINQDLSNLYVNILGSIRTYNLRGEEKTHLIINVFVEDIQLYDFDDGKEINANNGLLEGYICKSGYRKTPLNREISDVILAVNRNYGKSDYIPNICWGKNARYVSSLPIGTKIRVYGRLQSREYTKEESVHTVYEFSVQTVEVIENNEAV